MTTAAQQTQQAPRKAVDERPGDLTVIWRSGEVLRRSPAGKWSVRPDVPPLPHADFPLAAITEN